jgi:hypothetical protein
MGVAESPSRPVERAGLDVLVDSLARELSAQLGATAQPSTIRAQVRLPLAPLRGWVAHDSLSEMAVRLARHRLESSAGAGEIPIGR